MKTGIWTTLIFLIYVTFTPIIADEDKKLTPIPILSHSDNPSPTDAHPGKILSKLMKKIKKPSPNDVLETATHAAPSATVLGKNSDIVSEVLNDLDMLKRQIDCNILDVEPEANLKTLICQTIALSDYLQSNTADISMDLDNSLQALLSSILETVVHILRSVEVGIDHLLQLPENLNSHTTLRMALDPDQLGQLVKNQSIDPNQSVLKTLRDVVDETLNILKSAPIKLPTGVLQNCTNNGMDQISDILEGKITNCGLNSVIKALRSVINEILKRVGHALSHLTPNTDNDATTLPNPTISTPLPLSPAPLPLNPAPLPPNPAPLPLNPAPLPPSPAPLPPSPVPLLLSPMALPINPDATPLPDGENPTEPAKGSQGGDLEETMKNYIQNLKENPALQEAYENTKKFLNSAADTLQKEFEKISSKIRE